MLDRTAAPDPAAVAARLAEDNQRFGQRLRAARKAAGLSTKQLGAALAVTYQQVCKYETGKDRLVVARLPLIAELLGRDVEWFFGGREAGPTDWVVRVSGYFLREGGFTDHIDEAGRYTSARAIAEADRYEDGEACPASDFAGDRWRSRASLIAELEVLRATGEGAAHG